jgi:uncharacterized protein
MSTSISNAPWDGSASRFSPAEWAHSCVIDTGQGDPDSKARYRLPIREPGGALSRAGVHAAAARLNQVDVSADKKAAAARKLIAAYHTLGEDPPDSLLDMSKRGYSGPEIECRATGLPVEIRSSGTMRIGGLGAVFDVRSEVLAGGFREIMAPSVWNKSAGDGYPGVVCRFQHDDRMLLGATRSGTLRLHVNNRGLDYECDLPETRRDTYDLIARGDVAESSVAFQVWPDGDEWGYEDGAPLRRLISARLIDTAPVTTPAYSSGTSVALRSLARHMDAPIEDVQHYAEQDALARFFVRSDRPTMSGKQAQLATMAVRWPSKAKTGRQAQLETLARRWPSYTRPKTPQQLRIELEGCRWPPM